MRRLAAAGTADGRARGWRWRRHRHRPRHRLRFCACIGIICMLHAPSCCAAHAHARSHVHVRSTLGGEHDDHAAYDAPVQVSAHADPARAARVPRACCASASRRIIQHASSSTHHPARSVATRVPLSRAVPAWHRWPFSAVVGARAGAAVPGACGAGVREQRRRAWNLIHSFFLKQSQEVGFCPNS